MNDVQSYFKGIYNGVEFIKSEEGAKLYDTIEPAFRKFVGSDNVAIRFDVVYPIGTRFGLFGNPKHKVLLGGYMFIPVEDYFDDIRGTLINFFMNNGLPVKRVIIEEISYGPHGLDIDFIIKTDIKKEQIKL